MTIKNIQPQKRTPNIMWKNPLNMGKKPHKISSTLINRDIIIKFSLEVRIHHPRKHEQKEIREKTYHRNFLKG